MFKELGQMANLFKMLPKMKEEMEGFQQRIQQIHAEADVGGGMIKIKVNGRMEVLSCTISEEALSDREVLEDLICSAVNRAIEKVKMHTAEEASKMTSGLGISLPPGFELPGMS